MLNSMHTTQDIRKNGNHLDVRVEKKTAFLQFLCLRKPLKNITICHLVNKASDDRRTCVRKEAEFVCNLGGSVVLLFETIKASSY